MQTSSSNVRTPPAVQKHQCCHILTIIMHSTSARPRAKPLQNRDSAPYGTDRIEPRPDNKPSENPWRAYCVSIVGFELLEGSSDPLAAVRRQQTIGHSPQKICAHMSCNLRTADTPANVLNAHPMGLFFSRRPRPSGLQRKEIESRCRDNASTCSFQSTTQIQNPG